MKKLLTLSNVLKAIAVVFGLVSFFLMFADQLYFSLLSARVYVSFGDAFFGENGAVISFIGYLLTIIAAIAVCAMFFVKVDAKTKKYIDLGIVFAFILAAIFIFIEAAVVNGRTNSSTFSLSAAPIIAGIFTIISAISAGVSLKCTSG